jgi:predicted nucleotidyltransferase
MKYQLYNNSLCPDVWSVDEDGYKLNKDVRTALLKIAKDFVDELKIENELNVSVYDVVIIGSLTNYNWTRYSDIDLHVVVDYSALNMDKAKAQTMFDALKSVWNSKHDVKMKGFDVELYVQDKEDEPTSASEYSVAKDRWIKPPVKEKFNSDINVIKKKYEEYRKLFEKVLADVDENELRSVLDKIYKFRQAGLDSGGELSEENIVFKMIRASGYLDKLKDGIDKVYDVGVSVKEGDETLEDGLYADRDKNILWSDDEDEAELVPTDDENVNRMRTFSGLKMFAAYQISSKAAAGLKGDGEGKRASDDMTNLRHAVKHPKDAESRRIINKLVDISIRRMSKQLDFKDVSVIVPLGSSSNLNVLIANKIKKKVPNAVILSGVIEKETWKNVQLSDVWKREMSYEKIDGKVRVGPRRAKEVLDMKKINHADEEFQVSKVPRGLRRYYSYFYKTAGGNNMDVLKVLRDATVLVIDDTLEEGATMREALRIIRSFTPKEVLGYIFLWGKSSGI